MRHLPALTLCIALCACACQSTTRARVVEADPARRAALLQAVAALEGRWQTDSPDGPQYVEFQVSSNGSVVRELMFPGTPHEMTNMYALDGNALAMTHYCAGGNQPHMRASELVDGRMAFAFESVSDLKAAGETYMGSMVLVIVDQDHIEQHWVAYTGEVEDHSAVFKLERVR